MAVHAMIEAIYVVATVRKMEKVAVLLCPPSLLLSPPTLLYPLPSLLLSPQTPAKVALDPY